MTPIDRAESRLLAALLLALPLGVLAWSLIVVAVRWLVGVVG